MRNIYKHFAIMMTILICVSLVSATMASGYDNTTNGEADIKAQLKVISICNMRFCQS